MKRPAEPGAAAFLPAQRTLPKLREAAAHCEGCPLYERATQTVFGEGPSRAEIVFVGEQPGNDEDLAGHPFVGPAGRIFDRALVAAGIDRKRTYITNAVKHFKWEPRGKRRLHKKPASAEIWACKPWLEAELKAIKPHAVVLLGAVAAQQQLGSRFRVSTERGKPLDSDLAPLVIATVHPSSLLRAPTPEDRKRAFADFVADLSQLKAALKRAS